MIYVERVEPSDDFEKEAVAWMQTWQTNHPQKTTSQFWNLIRQRKAMKKFAKVLVAMFYGKCAFCESTIGHIAHPHIEHFYPKSRTEFQHLMFAWENWLIACPICNQNKRTKFPMCDDLPCLINPTKDSPSEHVDFIGTNILSKTKRGRKTIEIIGLNRTDLGNQRSFWLMTINSLLVIMCRVPKLKQDIREFLIWAMQSNAPYCAMTKAYLSKKVPKLANPKIPHAQIEMDDPSTKISILLDKSLYK